MVIRSGDNLLGAEKRIGAKFFPRKSPLWIKR
jgi:hypothetical protein